jgi:hypothetical protein
MREPSSVQSTRSRSTILFRMIVLAGLLGATALDPLSAGAQQPPDDSAIVVATAKYYRRLHGRESALFDPRIVREMATLDVFAERPFPQRNVGVVKAIAMALGTSVLSVDDTGVCRPPACQLKGGDAVLRFGVPEVNGNRATIRVYQFIIGDERSDGSFGIIELLLARDRRGWRVAKRLSTQVT